MVVLGLSILVASLTFVYYRQFPLALAFLQWLRRPSTSLQDVADQPQINNQSSGDTAQPSVEIPERMGDGSGDMKRNGAPTKAEEDRKAMPPPPFRKISSPTTPRASTSLASKLPPPAIPSFNLAPSPPRSSRPDSTDADDEDDIDIDNLPPPSFPALNSAQRAKPLPPRLAPTTPSISTGLMPPPSRPSPLPNRGPPASSMSAGLAPPPTHSAPPTKPRKKVLLTPGHSPLDWARLTTSPAFLAAQPSSLIRVPPSLLKVHNGRRRKIRDAEGGERYVTAEAWTVLGGKVYNISPYLPYHPGGEPELLRVAGKDGTRLFGEVHPWVNWEGMLENCLVGMAVEESEKQPGGLEDMD